MGVVRVKAGIGQASRWHRRCSTIRATSASHRGLDVTSTKHFAMMLTAAAALTIVPSLPAEAQIMYPFPPYRTAVYDSSVRFDVTPQQAEVFVDGYYAGIVDDFDGMLQRLRVEPGQHEITLYHDGYRTARQRVYLARDRTFKIRLQMEPLAPGEVGEARPVPAASPVGVQPSRPLPRDPRGIPPTSVPPPNDPPATPATSVTSLTGQLTIQVQPADADRRDRRPAVARIARAGHRRFRPLRRPPRDSGPQAWIRGVFDGSRCPSRRDDYPERQPAHSAIEAVGDCQSIVMPVFRQEHCSSDSA